MAYEYVLKKTKKGISPCSCCETKRQALLKQHPKTGDHNGNKTKNRV